MSTSNLQVPGSGAPAHTSGQSLKDYVRLLWHRKWLVVLIALLAVGGVQFLTFRQQPIYQASARMIAPPPAPTLVGSQINQPASTDIYRQTQAELIQSTIITELVAADLGVDADPVSLIRRIRVEVRPDSDVISILVTSPTAEGAASLTNSVVEQYLAYRAEQDKQAMAELRAGMNELIDANGRKLKALEKQEEELQEADPDNPVSDPAINQERASLLTENADYRKRLNDLRGIEQGIEDAGQILDVARAPGRPVSPDKVRNGIMGGILGLVLGAAAALLLEYMRDNLSSPEEVEAIVGAPALALVPMVGRSHRGAMLLSDEDAPGVLTESFRTLRTNLLFQAKRDGFKTLVVTSPSPGDGKTLTASNVAVALSQVGHRVVLVDGDLRRPRMHRLFGFDQNGKGLTTLLEGEGNIHSVIVDPHVPNLRVIGSGPASSRPTEVLAGASMARVVEDCEEASDFVIIDSPPAIGLADASALAAHTDGVLLVISQEAGRRVLTQTRDQLRKAGARVVGVVVNKVEANKRGYYYYDYYYPYYGRDENGGRKRRRREKARSARSEEAATAGRAES